MYYVFYRTSHYLREFISEDNEIKNAETFEGAPPEPGAVPTFVDYKTANGLAMITWRVKVEE